MMFPRKIQLASIRNVARAAIVWMGTACLFCSSVACGQTPPKPDPSPVSPATGSAPNAEADVMKHLNLVLRWSRQWTSLDVSLSRPSDEIYVQSGQSLAEQVVKLEFQSALAQAALIGSSSPQSPSSSAGAQNAVDAQNILNAQQRTARQIQNLKAELDAVNAKIPSARTKDRPNLLVQRDTLQGQLELAQALEDNLQKLTSFVSAAENPNGSTSEMTGRILALQRTIPLMGAPNPPNAKTAGKSTAAAPASPLSLVGSSQNEGLIGQMGEMIHLMSSLRVLGQLQTDTATLQTSTQQLRAPLLVALRATLQQGQIELGNAETNSAGNSPATSAGANTGTSTGATAHTGASVAATSTQQAAETPAQQQREMTDLVRHFKQLSNATLPLSQELVLLEQSQANLDQLQTSIKHDYGTILRTLLLRVAMILVALGLIWLFSWLWRRATFRYVRDARRRRQFLVLRRAVTGFCMFVVVLLGFVSDFSSLATYAGLITAGIAVALQAVILSIAAYFFLVGRYGVRVGDRVTVVYNGANAVSGDVVDIGLVRFYMMELAGSGVDMQPTGRICVFPNSVLFQTNPLFKQVPGTEYTWREVGLPLHREADVELAEKELLAAVNDVYASYSHSLERKQMTLDDTMAMHQDVPKPVARVRFTGSGLEALVRYPIPLRQAAELDDRMVKEVVEILRKNPAIRLADGASPVLRS
jgi:small-conductance mechanosensitive channel